jgi:FkbM family methyltransferase
MMSLGSFVKNKIKRSLHAAGVEVHRFSPEASPLARMTKSFRSFNIDLVIDIGANEGQFAQGIRAGGYAGRVVSVEPMLAAHERLVRESQGDAKWHVHPRCAVGCEVGEIELNIAGNSVSSSVLPMLAAHSNAAPESVYQRRETVPLSTLDLILPNYLQNSESPFLKIDTQGYEWQVLEGAKAVLPRVRGILMEISFLPLYEGQRLWRECVDRIQSEGFTLWALEPVFIDPANGRTLQMDALFFRE